MRRGRIRVSKEWTDSVIKKTYFSYIIKTYNSDIQNSARAPDGKST